MRSLSLSVFAILVLNTYGQEYAVCPLGTSPCQNEAECIGEGVFGQYTCHCIYGWAGKNCDVRTNQDCGYNLFETSGSLSSPNYPSDYGFNHNCHYYVRVHGAKQITFNVQAFDTEYAKDALQYAPGVQWNFSGEYTVLEGKLNTVPQQFTVQGSDVWFVFESDRNVRRPGFFINYTTSDPSNCASYLCQNGALCTDLQNDYYCACPSGYTGKNCEININECDGVMCTGGTVCVDGVNSYGCRCPPGYSGLNCAKSCMNKYCKNHLRPKCGSDGRTYRNRCYLLNAICIDSSVYMLSKGACAGFGPIAIIGGGQQRTCIQGQDGGSDSGDSSIEFVRCPPPAPTTMAPNPIVTKAPTPKLCVDTCPLIFEPVCGSDGVTYPNICKLDVVRCLSPDSNLIAMHVGACVVMTTPCRGDC